MLYFNYFRLNFSYCFFISALSNICWILRFMRNKLLLLLLVYQAHQMLAALPAQLATCQQHRPHITRNGA